jgi:branched-chain amino acid transport system permease protein
MADSPGGNRAIRDRGQLAAEVFDGRLRARLKALITDELIAEHAAKPLGQHSDALERVLNYFRRAPAAGKYVIVCTKPWQEWRIGVLSGVRGVLPTLVDGPGFASEADALHGVFLRRVNDLMAS